MNWLDPQEVREWLRDPRDHLGYPIDLTVAWSEFGRAVAATWSVKPPADLPTLRRRAHSGHWGFDDLLEMYSMEEVQAWNIAEVARLIRDAENGEQR